MKNQPGYPLPDGELGSDDIVCQLVYLPDRQEYWQAFYAALHYMTTWKAWERDDDKRGQDAAANWRAAFELTSECWRMTCLEQLQDDVAEILALMQLGNPCCDEMDITDGDQYTDRVEDGVGDVPQNIIDAGYASGTSDWAGFDDYKCMIVHVTVNQMSARLNELNELVNEYGAIAGSAAAIAAILAVVFATGGVAIVFGIIAGVGAVSLLYESLMGYPLLGNLADKVDTYHEELACSMYYSDGDDDALAELNNKIDQLFTTPEAVILKNLNTGPTLKLLYSGRYDQQDIAGILEDAGYELGDFNCDCDVPLGEYLEYWNLNDEEEPDPPFYMSATCEVASTRGYLNSPTMSVAYFDSAFWTNVSRIRNWIGIGSDVDSTITLKRLKFWYGFRLSNAGKLRVTCQHDGGTWQTDYDNVTFDVGAWVTEIFDPPLVMTFGLTYLVRFEVTNGVGGATFVDEITLDFDASPDV